MCGCIQEAEYFLSAYFFFFLLSFPPTLPPSMPRERVVNARGRLLLNGLNVEARSQRLLRFGGAHKSAPTAGPPAKLCLCSPWDRIGRDWQRGIGTRAGETFMLFFLKLTKFKLEDLDAAFYYVTVCMLALCGCCLCYEKWVRYLI